jgi:HNH endonuclease
MNLVRAQVDEQGKVIRVFRTTREGILYGVKFPEFVKTLPLAEAVGEIRRQVFERAEGACEWCGAKLTWETGEMHERLPKGKGGEQSIYNGVALCASCHRAPKESSAHGNRRWQTAKVSQ